MAGKIRSELERSFYTHWLQLARGLPEPKPGYVFHPTRRWELDFAWVEEKLAVEIEGGQWTQGRHQRGKGFQADMDKYNALTLSGWRLLRFTTGHFEDPQDMIDTVISALRG
jgi:very-short-patch-repair endonuclease